MITHQDVRILAEAIFAENAYKVGRLNDTDDQDKSSAQKRLAEASIKAARVFADTWSEVSEDDWHEWKI